MRSGGRARGPSQEPARVMGRVELRFLSWRSDRSPAPLPALLLSVISLHCFGGSAAWIEFVCCGMAFGNLFSSPSLMKVAQTLPIFIRWPRVSRYLHLPELPLHPQTTITAINRPSSRSTQMRCRPWSRYQQLKRIEKAP